ncbi:MAG: hypothetical protein R2862_00625 [Thermoanaerobaculia bacterium]
MLNRSKNLSIGGTPPIDLHDPAKPCSPVAAPDHMFLRPARQQGPYADAQDRDPAGTGSGITAPRATIFTFENASSTRSSTKELALRGRDNSNSNTGARPVYNRLYWNFTSGDGEFACAQVQHHRPGSGR